MGIRRRQTNRASLFRVKTWGLVDLYRRIGQLQMRPLRASQASLTSARRLEITTVTLKIGHLRLVPSSTNCSLSQTPTWVLAILIRSNSSSMVHPAQANHLNMQTPSWMAVTSLLETIITTPLWPRKECLRAILICRIRELTPEMWVHQMEVAWSLEVKRSIKAHLSILPIARMKVANSSSQ